MLELPNFRHMAKSTIQFESRNKTLLVTPWAEIITSKPLFENSFILRKPSISIFADIIQIVTIFINPILKDSKSVKRVSNYVSKKKPISAFANITKFADFW